MPVTASDWDPGDFDYQASRQERRRAQFRASSATYYTNHRAQELERDRARRARATETAPIEMAIPDDQRAMIAAMWAERNKAYVAGPGRGKGAKGLGNAAQTFSTRTAAAKTFNVATEKVKDATTVHPAIPATATPPVPRFLPLAPDPLPAKAVIATKGAPEPTPAPREGANRIAPALDSRRIPAPKATSAMASPKPEARAGQRCERCDGLIVAVLEVDGIERKCIACGRQPAKGRAAGVAAG